MQNIPKWTLLYHSRTLSSLPELAWVHSNPDEANIFILHISPILAGILLAILSKSLAVVAASG